MIKTVSARTPHMAWKEVLKVIKNHGVIIDNKKILNGIIVSEIEYPDDKPNKNPIFGMAFIDEYKKQFLNPDPRGFEYTYGQRLGAYPVSDEFDFVVTNQIDYIISELKRDTNSRRAQAITWNPFIDACNGLEDVPCLQLVRCRIMDRKVYMEAVFRSHDMLLGYYPNVLGLSYLHEHIAKELGMYGRRGSLTVVSMSPHVYITDKDAFKSVMGVNL